MVLRRLRRPALLVLAVAASGALGLLSTRAGRAQAANPMSTPACQCSAPTPVAGLQTTVVHCLCGGMSCVLAQSGSGGPVMQCVR